MAWSASTIFTAALLAALVFANPAAAFGAGNIASISRIEGINWRHGDIEDALLTLVMAQAAGGRPFSKLDVSRVYFGNWLRDYSQAIDVGTLQHVSAEAIQILLWVLGFVTFGYGTGEFEVTRDRLGTYQPTEHIDNPLGYANGEDARRYDKRLRGPVNQVELEINPQTGLKNYIASENRGYDTSAGLLRSVLTNCIELGRSYKRSRNPRELHDALRLLGTALHCLEDFAAHSNYVELALIELGAEGVFPHVGERTLINLPGVGKKVYPITTGTFGGVDFLHSVMGEFTDKATQSELQSLEGAMYESQDQGSKSFIQDLLNIIPGDFLGGQNNAGKMDEFQANAHQQQQSQQNITPKKPEEWTQYLGHVKEQLYPVLEWHDNIMKAINRLIEESKLLEQIEQLKEAVNIFVFSVIAPYIIPIINQIKAGLKEGSNQIIKSSVAEQHNTFEDPECTNPTHSMLSKDHFSNLLNEPAGKVAQAVVKWAVPQIMDAWDNERVNVPEILTRIIHGVFHHPVHRPQAEIRRLMFKEVEDWWYAQGNDGQRILIKNLSAKGVLNGDNHKPGVHDTGHGCGKPISPKMNRKKSRSQNDELANLAKSAVGGGAIGELVGAGVAFISGGGGNGPDNYKDEKKSKKKDYNDDDHRKERKEKKYKGYDDEDDKKKHKNYDEDEKKHRKHGDEDDDYKKKYKSRDDDDDDDDYKKKHKKHNDGADEKKYKQYGDQDDDYKKKYKSRDDDEDEYKKKHKKHEEDEKKYKKHGDDYDGDYQKKYKGRDDDEDDYKKKKDKKHKDRDDDDDRKKHKHGGHRDEDDSHSGYGRPEYQQSPYDSGHGRSGYDQGRGGSGGRDAYDRQQNYSQPSSGGQKTSYGNQDSFGRQQEYSQASYGGQQTSYGSGDTYGRQQEYSQPAYGGQQTSYGDQESYGRQQTGYSGGASYGRQQGVSQPTYGEERRRQQGNEYNQGRTQDSEYGHTSGYGERDNYSQNYEQEQRQQYGGNDSYGYQRSQSREREARKYESGHHGGRDDTRYGSEDREYGDSYNRRHDDGRSREDEYSQRGHHHHSHNYDR